VRGRLIAVLTMLGLSVASLTFFPASAAEVTVTVAARSWTTRATLSPTPTSW
jgi:hypothetical protein